MNDCLSKLLFVGKIGKTIGLNGHLNFIIHTDFAKNIKSGTTFYIDKNSPKLVVKQYNPAKNQIVFVGYESRESATTLINCNVYQSLEETISFLSDDEILYDELIGLNVYDISQKLNNNDKIKISRKDIFLANLEGEERALLGVIVDIERICDIDYLRVKRDKISFLVPFIPRYVYSASLDCLITIGAISLFEAL